jgi:hypothetical protein
MEGRIVPKFHEGNPMNPFGGASMSKTVQKGFKALIHQLGLTIRLWVVGSAHAQGSVRNGEKRFPEGTSENAITIRYDG